MTFLFPALSRISSPNSLLPQPPFTISEPTIILWHFYSLPSLVSPLPTHFCLNLTLPLLHLPWSCDILIPCPLSYLLSQLTFASTSLYHFWTYHNPVTFLFPALFRISSPNSNASFLPQTPYRPISALTPPPFHFYSSSVCYQLHSRLLLFNFIIVIYTHRVYFYFMFCYFYLVFYVGFIYLGKTS